MLQRLVILGALLPALGACYTYTDAELGDVRVDARIRARLSAVEADRLESQVGFDRRVVSGHVTAVEPEAFIVAVRTLNGLSTSARPPARQLITIPRSGIQTVELRRLHTGRTVGLVAASSALLGFILYQAFVREDPSGEPGENPPPVNQAPRVPLLSIPFPPS